MVAMSTASLVTALGVATAGSAEADASCTPNVGGTGLSAAVVATPRQTISHGTLDATGCDIGIYIGQGVRHVTIRSMTVTGANFQGIFAEKTSHVSITHSTITGNAFHTIDPKADPLPGSGVRSRVGQAFAISLFGVRYASVEHNRVYNNGRGGIGVMDNGPFDPGAMMASQDPTAPLVLSSHIEVEHNRTWANYNGCGIVAATQNAGGYMTRLEISHNRITGTGFGAAGPDIGGIVVAADPMQSKVTYADVEDNSVKGSFESGVLVNAEAPGSWTTAVHVHGNDLSGNNVGNLLPSGNTTGVIVFAAPGAANHRTRIWDNDISDQFYGVWTVGNFRPKIWDNDIDVTAGGVPISYN
jgi:hypothetical protein